MSERYQPGSQWGVDLTRAALADARCIVCTSSGTCSWGSRKASWRKLVRLPVPASLEMCLLVRPGRLSLPAFVMGTVVARRHSPQTVRSGHDVCQTQQGLPATGPRCHRGPAPS